MAGAMVSPTSSTQDSSWTAAPCSPRKLCLPWLTTYRRCGRRIPPSSASTGSAPGTRSRPWLGERFSDVQQLGWQRVRQRICRYAPRPDDGVLRDRTSTRFRPSATSPAEFFARIRGRFRGKFTLDLGLRLSHLGPWIDLTGYGFAASTRPYTAAGKGGTTAGATFPGVEWHAAEVVHTASGVVEQVLLL